MPETLAELRRCGANGFWPFLGANVAEHHIRCYPWTGGGEATNISIEISLFVFRFPYLWSHRHTVFRLAAPPGTFLATPLQPLNTAGQGANAHEMKRFNSAIDNPDVGDSPSAKIVRGGLHTLATTSGCAPKPSTHGQSPNGGSTIELLLEAARASDHSVPASTHGSCGKGLSPSAISNAQDAGQLGAPSKGYSPTDLVEAVDSSIDSDPEATQIGNTYFAEVAEAKRCIPATSREPTIAPAAAGAEIIPMDARVSVRDCLAPAAPEETASSSTTTESAIARPETADSRDKNRATEDAVVADTDADSAVAMAESQSSTERSARPCMACRLVRVRCDRKVPCSRCVRLEEPCRPPPYVRRGRPPWRHRGNAQLPTAPLLGRLDVHVSQLPGPNSCISLLPSGSTIHSASIVSPGPGRELYPTFHSTGPDCGRGLYPTFHPSGPDLGRGLYPAFHSAGQAVGAADGLGSHAMPVSAMQLLGSTRSAPIGHLNAPAVAVAHSASPILSAASSEQVSNLAGHGFWPEAPRNGTTIERLGAAQASIPHLAQPHVGGPGIPSCMPVQVGQPLQGHMNHGNNSTPALERASEYVAALRAKFHPSCRW